MNKIEGAVAKVAKDLPHLPVGGRKWLGENVWWIVIVGAGIAALASLVRLIDIIRAADALSRLSAYIPIGSTGTWAVTASFTSLALVVLQVIILAFAIQPLKNRQKKGWSLLFLTALVSAVAIVVTAVISLDVLQLILTLIFGAIFLAIGLYFVFEIRDQFGAAAKKTEAKPVVSQSSHKEDSK